MESHSTISKLLVKTGAFKDLDEPVILTSGELGIYYINTEKLCPDDGKWKEYGDNSQAMINHAIKIMRDNRDFREVIDILVEQAEVLLPRKDAKVISGGQRRDWLFSGPVANRLNLDHISLYKDGKQKK